MAQLFSTALLGFFFGMRHVTSPDHVVEVASTLSRERRVGRAADVGILSGLRHTVIVVLVGGAILLFDVVFPPRIGLTIAFLVAVMLVLLGVLSIRRIVRPPIPGGHRRFVFRRQSSLLLAIGVVDGLAGSAAVALLVLATTSNTMSGIAYLVVFGIGTVAGMTLITAVITAPLAYTSHRLTGLHRTLGVVSALSSLVFGVLLIKQIVFVNGLFTADPQWIPR